MTQIAIQGDKVVFRGGVAGTGAECCCGGCCCIDGAPDNSKTTRAACEAAGGTWNDGALCKTYDCRCCEEFKVICHERVWSTYDVVLGSFEPITNPCQPAAVDDTSEGLIAIDWGNVVCGGSSNSQYCTNDWASACNGPFFEIGDTGTFAQYYDRWRAVADCEECIDTGGAFCTPGVSLTGCYVWNAAELAGLQDFFCDCDVVDLCNNPLP